MKEICIAILRLPNSQGLKLPAYISPEAAGMDIAAAEDCILKAGEITLMPTGFAIALPYGFEAQIRPRSGLAIKNGISLVNSPGTIDSDYRGEIKLGLINLSRKDYRISRGDRVAQMVVAPVLKVRWEEVLSLDKTERDNQGFGHSGKSQ